jgi:hypothetical protein
MQWATRRQPEALARMKVLEKGPRASIARRKFADRVSVEMFRPGDPRGGAQEFGSGAGGGRGGNGVNLGNRHEKSQSGVFRGRQLWSRPKFIKGRNANFVTKTAAGKAKRIFENGY